MFERYDGALISVTFLKTDRKTRVLLFRIEQQDTLQLELTEAQFEELFRYDPALMNPNKTLERHVWIAERVSIIETDGQYAIAILKNPVSKVKPTISDHGFRHPFTGLTAADRDDRNTQKTSLDQDRERSICMKLEARKSRFLSHLDAIRSEKAQLEARKTERLRMEEDVYSAECQMRSDAKSRTHALRAQLEEARRGMIAEKMETRKHRDSFWMRTFFERKTSEHESSELRLIHRREERKRTKQQMAEESARFVEAMMELDRKRALAYEARETRWESKGREFLRLRFEAIKAAQRKQTVLKEKKQAQLRLLFF